MGAISHIDVIKTLICEGRYIITLHARARMDERNIPMDDLITLIKDGEIIEDYQDSKPCPSAPIMGVLGGQCCHAVVAICRNHLRIVTVYWPGDDKWIDGKKRKAN